MKNALVVILILMFSSVTSYSEQLKAYEKGQIAGELGFGAMTIDAYYEICYSKGTRTDSYLKGINKLLKEKWGFTYSEIATKQEKRNGQNYRQEAHELVNTVVKKTGGCNSVGMEKWFRKFEDIHENNLNKFHSVQ